MDIPRRSFLLVLASVLVRAEDRSNNGMRMLSVRPEDLEMSLDGFSAYITPIDRFFVRTHVPVPTVNVREWRLRIDGEVTMPLSLTIEDLRRLPATQLISAVDCPGTAPAFHEPPLPSPPLAYSAPPH